jgi:DNA polymerase-3 subunit alpha
MPAETPGQNQGRGRGTPMLLAGLVRSIRRRGNRGGYVAIDDHTGRVEVALFDETWTLYADLLNKDEIIVVEGLVSTDSYSGGFRISATKIMTLAEAKSRFAKGVQIALRGPGEALCAELQATFEPYRNGSARVWVDYSNTRARARLELGEEWNVKPCEELVAALGELEAVSDARLLY